MNIKDYTIEQLVEELASRPNVKKIAVGPYKNYSLKEKYSSNQSEIICDTVLVIGASSHMPDNFSKQI
jgi:uncharacterized protein YlbG (UPF0298 family)